MSRGNPRFSGRLLALFAVACLGAALSTEFAAAGFHFVQRQIGGVSIDAAGVVRNLERQQQVEIRDHRRQFLKELPQDLKQGVKLRKVSLKQLQQAALKSVKDNGGRIPDEVRFMAGLQRVQYIFVYPELKDVVLVGPAEGWRVNDDGEIVGLTTGRPVMHFDDLLVALRSVAANQGPITCSIDPTEDGIRRLRTFLKQQRTIGQREQTLGRIEEMMGMQRITLSGIDATTHFARILVAADYRMKRLAMGFDPAPLKGMSSYLEMARAGRTKNMMPRWWLEDDYQPLLTDADGMAFELRGQGVKAMTEDEAVSDTGKRRGTGQVDPVAQKWATTLTTRYSELADHEPVFGQLRNCMDLAVVSALILTENLHGKAGLDISPLLSSELLLPDKFDPPRQVPTLANALKKGSDWLISASGGVSVNPREVAGKREKSEKLAPQRDDALPPAGAGFWWN